ncbi:ABC transporter permease [Kiloniella laminariae]|uniref:ABC transporter permease n=1 Tax=Kiloniella laminariae TaxID=454162 RepID=UPI00036CAB85|nr:ABC transporter permease [Kiloniella laminariae]
MNDPLSTFFVVFLAVIMALTLAPVLQNNSARVWDNLRQIKFVRKNGVFVSIYLVGAVVLWVGLMIIAPQLYMVDYSFRDGAIGGNLEGHTLVNYSYLIFGRESDEAWFNWLHLQVFLRTIIASVMVTLLAFALCYPIAYYLAQTAKGGTARLFLICLILPFWVNEILRAFAFRILFGSSGVINAVLISIGLIDDPIDFIKIDVAMYAGLSYAYILLMVFPIYNAIESLDHNQIEAARDLGSPWWRIHYRVVIPYAKPGIASGCTMVFMLSAGALAVPQILGGPSSLWFTQIIYDWFFSGGDWARGSAYAFVLLFSCIIFVLTIMRLFKVNLGELAK